MKTIWYQSRKTQIDQWTWIENPQVSTYIWIYCMRKVAFQISGGNLIVLGQLSIYVDKES